MMIDLIQTHWCDYTTTMHEAYDAAVRDSRRAYGDSSELAATAGVMAHPTQHTRVPETEASALMDDRWDHLEKWGCVEAIPVWKVNPAQKLNLGYQQVTIVVDSDQRKDRDVITDLVVKALNRGDKSWVKQVDGVKVPKRFTAENVANWTVRFGGESHTTKTDTTRTEGKAVTRYYVAKKSGSTPVPPWNKCFDSIAEARKNLPTQFNTDMSSRERSMGTEENYEIVGVVRRQDGSALVEHTVTPKKTTMRLDVSVEMVTVPELVTDTPGWVFYGWTGD